MSSDSDSLSAHTTPEQTASLAIRPRPVRFNADESSSHTIFAFPPNRNTLGATSYLIVDEVNILVDCPAWNKATAAFLEAQGGVDWLVLSHRDGISHVLAMQQGLGCQVLIHEQEAYLLPEVNCTTFAHSFSLTDDCRAIWTPGHSPGSACLYYNRWGGVLFSGRHLLPDPQGNLTPLKTAKTFHWGRQIQSVQSLLDQFNPQTLAWICPGANTGFLRGNYAVEQAYHRLQQVYLEVQ